MRYPYPYTLCVFVWMLLSGCSREYPVALPGTTPVWCRIGLPAPADPAIGQGHMQLFFFDTHTGVLQQSYYAQQADLGQSFPVRLPSGIYQVLAIIRSSHAVQPPPTFREALRLADTSGADSTVYTGLAPSVFIPEEEQPAVTLPLSLRRMVCRISVQYVVDTLQAGTAGLTVRTAALYGLPDSGYYFANAGNPPVAGQDSVQWTIAPQDGRAGTLTCCSYEHGGTGTSTAVLQIAYADSTGREIQKRFAFALPLQTVREKQYTLHIRIRGHTAVQGHTRTQERVAPGRTSTGPQTQVREIEIRSVLSTGDASFRLQYRFPL